jgi:cytochrome c2
MSLHRVLGIAAGMVLGAHFLMAQDAAKGKEVFEQCGVCHAADSDEKKMGPGLKGLFKKKTLADGKTAVTEKSVMEKIDKGGNGMPAYEEMLEKKEKADLLAYLKTL